MYRCWGYRKGFDLFEVLYTESATWECQAIVLIQQYMLHLHMLASTTFGLAFKQKAGVRQGLELVAVACMNI